MEEQQPKHCREEQFWGQGFWVCRVMCAHLFSLSQCPHASGYLQSIKAHTTCCTHDVLNCRDACAAPNRAVVVRVVGELQEVYVVSISQCITLLYI